MIIGIAQPTDLAAILALETDGFEQGAWSERAWAEEICSERGHVLVGRDHAGAVVGVATFTEVGGIADLNRVIVRADRRGEGLAGRLVVAGMDWAHAAGADRVLLEVEEGNDSARALYERLGFETLGRRADYYGTGRHALVLVRALGDWSDDV